MNDSTKYKIATIQKLLYVYAIILAVNLAIEHLFLDAEFGRQSIRGALRSLVMLYLAITVWKLKRINWWLIAGSSCFFAGSGLLAAILGIIGGITWEQPRLLLLVASLAPIFLILVKLMTLILNKDVKRSFSN